MLPRPAPLRRARPGLFAAALAAVLATCSPAPPSPDDPDGLLAALARETRDVPTAGPAFSVPTRHRACPEVVPEGGTVPRSECGGRGERRITLARSASDGVTEVVARARESQRERATSGALHVPALVDVLWDGGRGTGLDRSIDSLALAVRLARHPAPALTDLSAAYLLRAGVRQTPRDLLEAVEAAERALEEDSASAPARFNRALALERLGLVDVAAWAWREFLALEPSSARADEARRRAAALEAIPPRPELPADAGAAEARAFAARAPQEALTAGWDRVLPEWGEAVLRGDAGLAERRLSVAAALGEGLEARGGDATLADAVRAVRARAGDAAATRRLAEAHAAYGRGRAVYLEPDYETADTIFAELAGRQDVPSPLAEWVALHRGATRAYGGKRGEGLALMRSVLRDVEPSRGAALAAHARWKLATTHAYGDSAVLAPGLYRDAAALFARTGEVEHQWAVSFLAAEAALHGGDAAVAFPAFQAALSGLRPYRDSRWLHAALDALARVAADEGLARASLRLNEESASVAGRTASSLYPLETRVTRVQLLAAAGRMDEAREELRRAEPLLGSLKPDPRAYFGSLFRFTTAAVSPPGGREDDAALDSAVEYFRGKRGFWYLRALVRRATNRLSRSRLDEAAADLDVVLSALESGRTQEGGATSREGEAAGARLLVDAMVTSRLAQERVEDALLLLERGRGALAAVPPRGKRLERLPRIPPGRIVIRYALVGDTLLAWTVADSAVRLHRATVPRARIRKLVEDTRLQLETGSDAAALVALTALDSLLFAPLQRKLDSSPAALVVIADGELAAVPFAALRDGRSGRFRVEDRPIRLASSLREASAAPEGPAPHTAVLVADPAFDPRAHAGLDRLDGAAGEVRDLAATYAATRTISGNAATADAVVRILEDASVFHFAGHAVYDDLRPERSFLLMAADADAPNGGRLTARKVARLDLDALRIVVLSACSTLRPSRAGGEGFTGLTGALLGAGADGVVASLWSVGDEPTRMLMIAFHRAYRRTGNASAALREAQLQMLRSPDPRMRAPSAWAGFVYAGT